MSGHSHWSKIKHQKLASDARKGALFSKMARAITVAAKKGADPKFNISLQKAIDDARAVNMPGDKIQAAIDKAAGPGADALQPVTYEGIAYGQPIIVEVITDNSNRTVAEIRKIFERNNAKFGQKVGHMFEKKGYINISRANASEDAVMELALEAGAEYEVTDEGFEVTCSPDKFNDVKKAFEARFKIDSAAVELTATNETEVDPDTGKKIIAFVTELEDHDDVQKTIIGCKLPESVTQ